MGKTLKALAILVLLATIAGAGLVLYGLNTLAPEVEQTMVLATPASQAQEIFDSVMDELEKGTFTGHVFGETGEVDAQSGTFVTYTVRLSNKGFFPAEWISLEIHPQQNADGSGYDVLQLDNNGPNALYARSRGDIAATILRAGDAQQMQRDFTVTCYVFGKQIIIQGNAQ